MSEDTQKTSVEMILDAADVLSGLATATKSDSSNEGIMASCAALEASIRAIEFAKSYAQFGSSRPASHRIAVRIWGVDKKVPAPST
jgi:hypothetical protein